MLPQEMQGNRTVPPSQVAGGPIRNNDRFGNMDHPWVLPTSWHEQQELLRYQVDPEAEADLQRSLAKKREESLLRIQEKANVHAQQVELLKLKHELSLASYDHKQESKNASTAAVMTRSRCSNDDKAKMLVYPDWDLKNPATMHQAVAIFLDHYFESSSLMTNCVTEGAINEMFCQVMRFNVLGFESIGEQTVAEFHECMHYKYEKMLPMITLSLISTAKTQFPRAGQHEARRAWKWSVYAIEGFTGGSQWKKCIRNMQPRMDRIMSLAKHIQIERSQILTHQ